MRALLFNPTIPRFAATKLSGVFSRRSLWGRFSPLQFTEVSDPPLPAGAGGGRASPGGPVLPCAARGIAPPCVHCAAGDYNLCLRFTEGKISPGLLIGACRDTGGSWGENFVAPRSQGFPLPEHVTDGNALLVEPMAG